MVLLGVAAGLLSFGISVWVGWLAARFVQAREDAAIVSAGDALARCVRQAEWQAVSEQTPRWEWRAAQALAMWDGLNEERGKRV